MSSPAARWIATGTAALALGLVCLVLAGAGADAFEPVAPTPSTVDAAIARSTGYIARHTAADGRFTYVLRLDGLEVQPAYNLLRHGGTMYAMTMAAVGPADTPVLRAALRRAMGFLRGRCLGPVPGQDDMLAVWSTPALSGVETRTAKLGGAGLALLAMARAEPLMPGIADADEMHALARFIGFMQREDGAFISKYTPDEGGFDTRWHSQYYPGEACYGLLALHALDPDPRWLVTAANGLAHLARNGERGEVFADHWCLLALGELLPRYDQIDNPPIERERLVQHAARIATHIIEHRHDDGSFTPWGLVTPTATRLEGLQAVLPMLHDADGDLAERVQTRVDAAIGFLLAAQVSEGEHAGAFPRAVAELPDNGSDSRERFNARVPEVRIDYVQHALSALIQWRAQHPDPSD